MFLRVEIDGVHDGSDDSGEAGEHENQSLGIDITHRIVAQGTGRRRLKEQITIASQHGEP